MANFRDCGNLSGKIFKNLFTDQICYLVVSAVQEPAQHEPAEWLPVAALQPAVLGMLIVAVVAEVTVVAL